MASPPLAVSLMLECMFLATLFMASTTSSKGISEISPMADMSQALKAWETPNPFRLIQGISTSPPMGSQASPSIFWRLRAAAVMIWVGVKP